MVLCFQMTSVTLKLGSNGPKPNQFIRNFHVVTTQSFIIILRHHKTEDSLHCWTPAKFLNWMAHPRNQFKSLMYHMSTPIKYFKKIISGTCQVHMFYLHIYSLSNHVVPKKNVFQITNNLDISYKINTIEFTILFTTDRAQFHLSSTIIAQVNLVIPFIFQVMHTANYVHHLKNK